MARLILAESAGFCFGVDRAVRLINDLLDGGKKVVMLGPIIHNPSVIDGFINRGVDIVNSVSEAKDGTILVLRTHGVEKDVMSKLESDGTHYADATCPFVKKIHRIADENSENAAVIICGDPEHPEVKGIKSFARGEAYVVNNEAELENLLIKHPYLREKPVILVSQTTFSSKEWGNSVKKAKLLCTNIKIFDTICSATEERQKEAYSLSLKCDAMVIVGGRQSSNTAKLGAVCRENAKTFLVEDARELTKYDFRGFDLIGVSAGASTPAGIIKEVLKTMSEILNENSTVTEEENAPEITVDAENGNDTAVKEESAPEITVSETGENDTAVKEGNAPEFTAGTDEESYDYAAALEESLSNYGSEKLVVGSVISVTPTEIQVDIGRKQTGYIPYDEYSGDPSADPMTELKPGDKLDLIIMKTNDLEGTVMLSKRICDAAKVWDDIVAAEESGDILEGTVCDVIRGGVLVRTKGVRIFVPASLVGASRDTDLETLLHTTVNLRIIEVNKQRKRAVGSIRAALRDSRREAERAFWDSAKEGEVIKGTVKSITNYGAFVDIGGVDGMVHISELSWKRIKHPSEIVKAGDTVEVYIKNLDYEKKKISLGYKKIEDNPWEILKKDYPVDSIVEVRIVGLTTFGAFAQIIPGIDGLIHISQMANRRIAKTSDALSVGDTVTAKITDINFEKKRVSLSIRALLPPNVEPDVEPDVELGEAPDEIQTSADSSTPAADAAPKEDGIYLAETPDETAKAEESFIAPEEPEIAEEAISEETVSGEAVSEEEAVAKEEVSKDEADSEEAEKTRDEDALEDSKEEKTE